MELSMFKQTTKQLEKLQEFSNKKLAIHFLFDKSLGWIPWKTQLEPNFRGFFSSKDCGTKNF